MNNALLKSILSMDSYNRGYNSGIQMDTDINNSSVNQKIGNAIIIQESDIANNSEAVNEGFYAVAYEIKDTQGTVIDNVISYRGTDDPLGQYGSGSDIINGWLIGLGVLSNNQLGLAIEFYTDVAKLIDGSNADFQTVNLSTTGHSLGGGLASYIAAIYGQDSQSFDAMPFTIALDETIIQTTKYDVVWIDSSNVQHQDNLDYVTLQAYEADPNITVQSSSIINPFLKQLIYGTPNPLIEGGTWAVDVLGVDGTYLAGESLEQARELVSPPYSGYQTENSFYGDYYLTTYGSFIDNGVDPDDLDHLDYHSMSTLIISMFADVGGVGETALDTEWQDSAQYFWPIMYDDTFANQIGMFNVAGQSNDDGKYADILRSTIAYSAIDQGTTVFGDTGIRALYDDAIDLGKAVTTATVSSALLNNADNISKAFVQFAGTLALNKIHQVDFGSATDGVLDYYSSGNYLAVNFDDPRWEKAGGGTVPPMIARQDMVSDLLFTTASQEVILRDAMEMVWGDRTTNIFDRVVFTLTDSSVMLIPNNPNAIQNVTLFVAGAGTNTIYGGNESDEFILGNSGIDTIFAQDGNDIIVGGAGDDIIDGGYHFDTLDYSRHTTSGVTGVNVDFGSAQIVINGRGYRTITDSWGDTDFVRNVENFILTPFDDTLTSLGNILGHERFFEGGAGTDTFVLLSGGAVDIRNGDITIIHDSNTRATLTNFETLVFGDPNPSPFNLVKIILDQTISDPFSILSGTAYKALDYSTVDTGSLLFDVLSTNVNITGAGVNQTFDTSYVYQIEGSYGGDVYSVSALSHDLTLNTGRGDDVVTLSDAGSTYSLFNRVKIYYSGGDDVYNIGSTLETINLASDIVLADIHIGSVSKVGANQFQTVLNIAGHGSIALNYNSSSLRTSTQDVFTINVNNPTAGAQDSIVFNNYYDFGGNNSWNMNVTTLIDPNTGFYPQNYAYSGSYGDDILRTCLKSF